MWSKNLNDGKKVPNGQENEWPITEMAMTVSSFFSTHPINIHQILLSAQEKQLEQEGYIKGLEICF